MLSYIHVPSAKRQYFWKYSTNMLGIFAEFLANMEKVLNRLPFLSFPLLLEFKQNLCKIGVH